MPPAIHNRLNHAVFLVQIVLNALMGYAFAKVLALRFGTTASKDGFDIAYSVPFIVLNISGFLFIHAIVTTEFTRLLAVNPRAVSSVFSATLNCMLLFSLILASCCAWGANPLTAVLGPGLSPEIRSDTARLIRWLLPLVPILGISTYFSAVLTAYSVPISTELCQLIARGGAIAYLLSLGWGFNLTDVAFGLLIASVVGLATEWAILRRVTGLRLRMQLLSKEPEFIAIMRQGLMFLLVAIVAQISWAYMRRLATLDGIGTTAALTYAMALISPLSLVLGKPLALTIGPHFATQVALGSKQSARRSLVSAMLLCGALSSILAATVSIFATPFVTLLFGGGQFDSQAIVKTASLSRIVVWGVPAVILNMVLLMPLLASSRSHAPALLLGLSYCVHVVVTAILFPLCGANGLAYAYVCYVVFQCVTGVALLHTLLQRVDR